MSLETSCLDNGISSIVTLDISNKRRIERTRERSYISDRHLDQKVYCKCVCVCVRVYTYCTGSKLQRQRRLRHDNFS